MTDFLSPPRTDLDAPAAALFEELLRSPTGVLCGRNNSGKSFLLRQLLRRHGTSASYLGPARYSNFVSLSAYGPRTDQKDQRWHQHYNQLWQNNQNVDNSPINLQQSVAELSDSQRVHLFALIDELLGSVTEVRPTVPGNSMSQNYIAVNGHNLSFTSSGYRLIATLLTALFDTEYSVFIVDEPELGLSPEAQSSLADFLFDDKRRAEKFPHIKSVFLATHSPIFLDRRRLRNNYVVSKSGPQISLSRIESVQGLNRLQFFLLGNRFETMFLPGAIVLVEGKTDHAYLSRVFATRYPDANISVVSCGSDGRMQDVVATAKQLLGDLRRSPYADRLFVVLDSVHTPSVPEGLVRMGVDRKNIIVWQHNGIEHLYPHEILADVFGHHESLDIVGDVVSANGISARKAELCEKITARVVATTAFPTEIHEKLLSKLDSLLAAGATTV